MHCITIPITTYFACISYTQPIKSKTPIIVFISSKRNSTFWKIFFFNIRFIIYINHNSFFLLAFLPPKAVCSIYSSIQSNGSIDIQSCWRYKKTGKHRTTFCRIHNFIITIKIRFIKRKFTKHHIVYAMQYLPPNRKRFCMRKESGTLPVRINKHHIQNTIAAIRFHFYIYVSS